MKSKSPNLAPSFPSSGNLVYPCTVSEEARDEKVLPLNLRQTYSVRHDDIKPIQPIYRFFDDPLTVFASFHNLDRTTNHTRQKRIGRAEFVHLEQQAS